MRSWWMDVGVVGGASLFLLLGGFLLTLGVRNIWRGHASEGWPKVAAIVSSSETSSNTTHDRHSQSSTTYSANIQFRYRAEGQEYTTTVRQFGQSEGSGDSSEAVVTRFRYPSNATVTVSYDPANPSSAAAEPGFTVDALWLPGAGLAFAVPAIMFIVLWFGTSRGDNRGIAIGLGMFAGIFSTIGSILLAAGLTNLARASQSAHWPQAKGVIVYGRVGDGLDNKGLVDDSRQFVPASGDRVVYRFQVDGHTYFSNIRKFGQVPESNRMDSDVPSLYPLGRDVSVLYSPRNPNIAALEPGPAKGAYWVPCAGSAFLLFGLAVFFFGIPALTR